MRRVNVRTRLYVAAVVVIAFFFVQDLQAQSSFRTLRDIRYSDDKPSPQQTLDLYLPDVKSPVPVVVYIHSGEGANGDKGAPDATPLVQLLLSKNIAVAAVNYRLPPANKYPAQLTDVARALAWLRKEAKSRGIDANKIFIAGISWGAHLASLLTLHPTHLQDAGVPREAIAGVIGTSGIYDLVNLPEVVGGPSLKELALGSERDVLREASPALYVSTATAVPPFLITFTDHDLYGLDEQARRFYSLFLRKGFGVELAQIPDRTHFNQLQGIGRKLAAVDKTWNPNSGRTVPARVTDDVLGPAISEFIDDILAGRAQPSALLARSAPQKDVIKDLAYSEGSDADSKLHTLDLYLPRGADRVPVVIFVHGGGWRVGDKVQPGFENFVDPFIKAGLAVASINYRLSPAVVHPAHVQDVAKAIAWIQRNGRQHRLDPDRMVLAGHSAGSHLVSLVTLNTKYLAAEDVSRGSIKGVMALSGVYDMVTFVEPGVLPPRVEQAFGTEPPTLEDASPARFVQGRIPPFLVACTDSDLFTLREEALRFWMALLAAGAQATFIEVPGRTHFNTISGTGVSLYHIDDTLAPAMIKFVRAAIGDLPGSSNETLAAGP